MRRDGDVAAVVESGDAAADLAVAEGGDDRAFGGVGLASVLDQLDGLGSAGEGGEDAAGFDRWELLRVADQDHLGVGSDGGVDHGGEHAGCRACRPRR